MAEPDLDEDPGVQALQRLKRQRGTLKGNVTKFANFTAGFSASRHTLTELKLRLKKIEQSWDAFEQIQNEILELEEGDAQEQQGDQFQADYFAAIAAATDIIQGLEPLPTAVLGMQPPGSPVTQPPPRVGHSTRRRKVPVIQIPKFSGDYKEWRTFEDTFKSLIDHDDDLDKIEKFHYLRDHLVGDSRGVIDNLEVTETNYQVAWDLLESRFNKKKLIRRAHVGALFDANVVTKQSYLAVRVLLDEFSKHLRALKASGVEIEKWDVILVYLFTSKLDEKTKLSWEEHSANMDEPTFQQLADFMNSKCSVLESAAVKEPNYSKKADQTQKPYGPSKDAREAVKSKVDLRSGSLVTTNNSIKCPYCDESHYIQNCLNFLKLPINERLSAAKSGKLCSNCLQKGHKVADCRSRSCKYCSERHNNLLHVNSSQSTNSAGNSVSDSQTNSSSNPNSSSSQINVHCSLKNEQTILLSTAQVEIFTSTNQSIRGRALLDSGSQSNFMTNSMAKRLGLSIVSVKIPISGIGRSSMKIKGIVEARIKSIYNSFSRTLQFSVINQITNDIPQSSMDNSIVSIPENISLADPSFYKSSPIDILLGAGVFWSLFCVGQISTGKNQPIFQKSHLGWVISGPLSGHTAIDSNPVCHAANLQGLQDEIERFWTLGEIAGKPEYSVDEKMCENNFIQTTVRDNTGRFVVTMPIRETNADFNGSKETTLKRFKHLENKFIRNAPFKTRYHEFLKEYEELQHMTKLGELDLDSNDPSVCYSSHHGVSREARLTTKLRVVFDASSKSGAGFSLNDLLLTGPSIQEDLFSILVRFREHNFVMVADVEKMYRQVLISKNQPHLQRIIWRYNSAQPHDEYELNTLTYGTASASFIATRCLHELGVSHQYTHKSASRVILSDFYMDDLLTGASSVSEAAELRKDLCQILGSAGFWLRKWVSNDKAIVEDESLFPNGSQYVITDNSCIKTLGLIWDSAGDLFRISFSDEQNELSYQY